MNWNSDEVLILGEVSAIILAAGKGERMWPLTSTRPKPLLEVLCKPMLQYHLEALADLGIKKAVLVTHSHEDLLKKTSSSIAEKIGMSLSFVRQSEPLGTGHAVREAIEVSGIRGETVIVYSDIFMTPRSLKDAISKALSSPSRPFGKGRNGKCGHNEDRGGGDNGGAEENGSIDKGGDRAHICPRVPS
jgi:choline kinase